MNHQRVVNQVDLSESLKNKIEKIQKFGFQVNSINCVKFPKSMISQKILSNRMVNSSELYVSKEQSTGILVSIII